MDSLSAALPAGTAPLFELDRIVPDADQPRKTFHEGPLLELAERLWIEGLIQPVTITPGTDEFFVIFVGERRVRAFRLNRERARLLLEANPDLPDVHPARWYQCWTAIPALLHPPMPPPRAPSPPGRRKRRPG